uniref:TCF3 fusion partner n=1 Tax=Myxine glutinosa TaxID=7769 RepID=UPI00358E2DCF
MNQCKGRTNYRVMAAPNAARDECVARRRSRALRRRCAEIETVNRQLLNRVYQVKRITRRLQRERRFLMTRLEALQDNFHNIEMTPLYEEENSPSSATPVVVFTEELKEIPAAMDHALGPTQDSLQEPPVFTTSDRKNKRKENVRSRPSDF